jgi:hypothetical protein
MPNRITILLVSLAVVAFVGGCAKKIQPSLSEEQHRRAFFSVINPKDILDYEFLYNVDRGHYVSVAKITVGTNFAYTNIQKDFKQTAFIDAPADCQMLVEFINSRAGSLLGGTNYVPLWLNPSPDSSYSYMEKQGSSNHWHVWWNISQNTLYFVGSGKGGLCFSVGKGQ